MDTTKIAYFLLIFYFGWLPACSGTSTSETFYGVLTDNSTNCGGIVCDAETEVCRDDSFCECRPHFENIGSFQCVPCPAEGQHCRGCCISDALTCYRGLCQRCSLDSNGNCICIGNCYGAWCDFFKLSPVQNSSQSIEVSNVTAYHVYDSDKILCLIHLPFKNNSSRILHIRRNNQVLESEFRQSVVSRVSLSSIQQRVIRRLRDRPPKYETRHNYEYQQRQTERQTSQQSTSTDNARPRNPVPIGGPPPAYDGDTVSLAENPPPYTHEQSDGPGNGITVIDIPTSIASDLVRSTDLPNDRNSSNNQGVTNQAFEPDKVTSSQPQIIQPPANGESGDRPKDECYDIPLVSSNDKTVYM
uniref:EGF-like domain-containing protein n=1 Tax=Anopheles epiroticus TaxID=199890 RepID=A0A182PQA2_9DIPT